VRGLLILHAWQWHNKEIVRLQRNFNTLFIALLGSSNTFGKLPLLQPFKLFLL
jgi:hypothetical protein